MFLFWSIAALLVAATLGVLLPPLLRRSPRGDALDPDAAAIAVFRDQKRSLDAEYAAKTIFKERIAHGILSAGYVSAIFG